MTTEFKEKTVTSSENRETTEKFHLSPESEGKTRFREWGKERWTKEGKMATENDIFIYKEKIPVKADSTQKSHSTEREELSIPNSVSGKIILQKWREK